MVMERLVPRHALRAGSSSPAAPPASRPSRSAATARKHSTATRTAIARRALEAGHACAGVQLKSPQLLLHNGTPTMLYNAVAKPNGELKSPQLLLRSYTGARPELGHRPHGVRHVCTFPQAGNQRTSRIFFIRLINVKK